MISRKKYTAGYTFLRKIRNLRGEINKGPRLLIILLFSMLTFLRCIDSGCPVYPKPDSMTLNNLLITHLQYHLQLLWASSHRSCMSSFNWACMIRWFEEPERFKKKMEQKAVMNIWLDWILNPIVPILIIWKISGISGCKFHSINRGFIGVGKPNIYITQQKRLSSQKNSLVEISYFVN